MDGRGEHCLGSFYKLHKEISIQVHKDFGLPLKMCSPIKQSGP